MTWELSCSSTAFSSSMSGECRKEPNFRLLASQHDCMGQQHFRPACVQAGYMVCAPAACAFESVLVQQQLTCRKRLPAEPPQYLPQQCGAWSKSAGNVPQECKHEDCLLE